ncbi:3892_t:CDS:2, partial [Paraglomus brasilianum]
PDCKKEIESTVDATPGSQNINDLMDISPTLFNEPLFYSSPPKKRVAESASKSSSKKVKQASKQDSPTLQRLIKELTTPTQKIASISSNTIILQSNVSEIDKDSVNFRELYDKITNAEDNNQKITQDLIFCYHDFGKGSNFPIKIKLQKLILEKERKGVKRFSDFLMASAVKN